MKQIQYVSGGIDLLDRISPLWEQLNSYHKTHSIHFKGKYGNLSFQSRKEYLLKKSLQGDLHIILAMNAASNEDLGYCVVSLLVDRIGEIDSLFVIESFRSYGIGKQLMEQSLNWLTTHSPKKIIIGVSTDNHAALSFYTHFGFFPCITLLEQPPDHAKTNSLL